VPTAAGVSAPDLKQPSETRRKKKAAAMDTKQSDVIASPITHALFYGRYTLEGPFADIERCLDRANEFIDNSRLPGMESTVCYLDGGEEIDGAEPVFTVYVDLPLSAFEPFHRFVIAG
jgi:hypothetical protein